MKKTRRFILTSGASLALAMVGSNAFAADPYPSNTIKLLAPFAAGGGTDNLARRIIPYIGDGIGDRLIVENKPGANSIIATAAAIQAPADGYTLLLQTNSLVVNPFVVKNIPFDYQKQLIPITQLSRTPHVLVVSRSVQAKSIRELVEYAKANPGKLNYASAGIGSTNHLAAELFSKAAGVKMEHITYKGSAEVLRDLQPGTIQVFFAGADQAATLTHSGVARALAITSAKRSASLPDVPTFAELGLGVEIYSWTGVFAPAKTPAEIVQKLARAMQAATRENKVREMLSAYEMIGSTPDEFATFLKREQASVGELLKTLDLTATAR